MNPKNAHGVSEFDFLRDHQKYYMQKLPPAIDTHAHLDELPDPEAAIQEAQKGAVLGIVAVGQDIRSNQKTLEIASQHPGFVFPAVGYHPWRLDADHDEETFAYIDTNLKHCVALGEVGLDYKAKTKKKVQKAIFRELLAIAKKHDKPVIVHCRYVHETAFRMVKEAGLAKAIFHWYSGPLDLIPVIAGDGYYMSATPALLYNPYHAAAIRAVPLSNLLLETDAPVQYQELAARPVHVQVTLKEVAGVKGVSVEEIAAQTTQNAKACFGLGDIEPGHIG
ncbi:MAG: TatD family hydrolase [Desulfobacterales bacterium]|nr:MAG: TatD family hydrolase [Desulfobacterales bacterium]